LPWRRCSAFSFWKCIYKRGKVGADFRNPRKDQRHGFRELETRFRPFGSFEAPSF
jgi:hypothetical protein